jgi:hypothetical protein
MDVYENDLVAIKAEVEQFLQQEDALLAGEYGMVCVHPDLSFTGGLEFAEETKQAWIEAGTQVQQLLQGHSQEVSY